MFFTLFTALYFLVFFFDHWTLKRIAQGLDASDKAKSEGVGMSPSLPHPLALRSHGGSPCSLASLRIKKVMNSLECFWYLNIVHQPLEPVNIKSSVTSRDNTALLCPVAAYVHTSGAGFPAGGRRGSILPLWMIKRKPSESELETTDLLAKWPTV